MKKRKYDDSQNFDRLILYLKQYRERLSKILSFFQSSTSQHSGDVLNTFESYAQHNRHADL